MNTIVDIIGREPGAGSREPGAGSREPGVRSVLAASRNIVSAIRLFDILSVFADDGRLSVEFTVVPGSKFAADTAQFLERRGARLIAWAEACAREFDLAIATSPNGELELIRAPILLLPHGAGFNKSVFGGPKAPNGLAGSQLMREGRVVPRVIGLEHADQVSRLARECPAAVERAMVIGDPCRDRMAAGSDLRADYRRALDVDRAASRKLIVLSSTWGPGSLFESRRELIVRLLAQLPVDEYRIAAVVHPNVVARHRAWEVERLLGRALAAGLLLIPAEEWEAVTLAADLLIGDHGSVTLYAAAAGTRVVFGAYDDAEIMADSPMAALRSALPGLDVHELLEEQIREALDQTPGCGPGGEAYEAADAALALPGQSLSAIRQVAYGLLDLRPLAPEPRALAPLAPSVRFRSQSAHVVFVDDSGASGAGLAVTRFPAAVESELVPDKGGQVGRHLVVETSDRDPVLRHNAEILLISDQESDQAARDALARYVDCVMVSRTLGSGRCVALVRDFGLVYLAAESKSRGTADAAILPSVLLAEIHRHGDPKGTVEALRGGVLVRVGGWDGVVRVYEPCEPVEREP